MNKRLLEILKGDLARSSSIIFISSIGANLILFFTNLFIANQIGNVNFGIFKTVFYLFSFLPLLTELGINTTLTKYVAEFGNKNKGKVG